VENLSATLSTIKMDGASRPIFTLGYNRLIIYLPNGEAKQLIEPKKIDNFWSWLFAHPDRVGVKINTKKVANIASLTPFLGAKVALNEEVLTVDSLIPVIGGVNVILKNSQEELIYLRNAFEHKRIDVQNCLIWFESFS